MVTYFTAIIVSNAPQVNGNQFLKYRNIPPGKLKSFISFASKFPGIHHINLYDKNTKKFVRQIGPKEIQGDL